MFLDSHKKEKNQERSIMDLLDRIHKKSFLTSISDRKSLSSNKLKSNLLFFATNHNTIHLKKF
jgi:hypothetical protein